MELPENFDLDALLAPIAGDNPAGVDVREDFSPQSLYFRLRDARAEARETERTADAAELDQGGSGGQEVPMAPQWRTVRDLATKILAEQSKDLEVGAWLTEALIRTDGLRGLAAGARLIEGLTQTFWESNIYPLPDEDGIETRIGPVAGLNGVGGDGTLIQPLRKLALWQRADGSKFAFWQFGQSVELASLSDPVRVEARLAAGVVPFDDMEREARTTGAKALAVLREDAAAALQAWQSMSNALDARAGADSPPSSRVRELLQQLTELATKYAPGAASEAPAAAAAGQAIPVKPGVPMAAAAGPAAVPVSGTDGATREDMLGELARIADYFRLTEPHSPLAYTLDEAVRRGRMSWPQLLEEIVPDATARGAIQMALGIKPPEAS